MQSEKRNVSVKKTPPRPPNEICGRDTQSQIDTIQWLLTFAHKDQSALHTNKTGMPMLEFIRNFFTGKVQNAVKEYQQMTSAEDFNQFTQENYQANMAKNRYKDVRCFDHSRVALCDRPKPEDYIHANYCDGYQQKKAYISCQAPTATTAEDFWRMVWQEESYCICMLTRTFERNKEKCFQYWPSKEGERLKCGNFEIATDNIVHHGSFDYTQIKVSNLQAKCTRPMVHLLYFAWPDLGLPTNIDAFLDYLQIARLSQYNMHMIHRRRLAKYKESTPPIVVHCSAGIGRSGTFIAVDICCRKASDCQKVSVIGTVKDLRKQRCLAVQKVEQYVFACLSVARFIIKSKLHDVKVVDNQYELADSEAKQFSPQATDDY